MNLVSPLISLAASRMAASARIGPSLSGIQGVSLGLGIIATTALGAKTAGIADGFLLQYPYQQQYNQGNVMSFAKTVGRTLVVPGLVEELVWRVAMVPHPAVDGVLVATTSIVPRILLVNLGFTIYHLAMPNTASHPAERNVFWDPAFLGMAFVLGNACSLAYTISGYALWAPVMVHVISISVWLDGCGGEDAMRGSMDDDSQTNEITNNDISKRKKP